MKFRLVTAFLLLFVASAVSAAGQGFTLKVNGQAGASTANVNRVAKEGITFAAQVYEVRLAPDATSFTVDFDPGASRACVMTSPGFSGWKPKPGQPPMQITRENNNHFPDQKWFPGPGESVDYTVACDGVGRTLRVSMPAR